MYYGWDISTAIIGLSTFDSSRKFLSASYCDLRKLDGLNEKADQANLFVTSVRNVFVAGDVHFVEDKLAGFSGGGSNAGTIMRLAAFNAMVTWMIHCTWGHAGSVVHIHPSTVKAKMKAYGLIYPKGSDKKKLTLDWVKSREPSFPIVLNRNGKPQPYCFDQADGFITAMAGFRVKV